MAVKRRTVWFSDEDWKLIREVAAGFGVTPSAYLRSRAFQRSVTTETSDPAFNSRPFTPVPKK